MNLMKFGYKKEEIQIRKMTMAELRLGVVQELLKKNYRYAEIRLVNTTCGEVDIFLYKCYSLSNSIKSYRNLSRCYFLLAPTPYISPGIPNQT